MSIDPLKKPLNRGRQLKTESQTQRGVKLYDIDLAIAEHMIDVIVPTVESMGEKIKVPVMYGNPERWKSVQTDGYFRDREGKIQIPLIMFRRNSIARDGNIASTMNRNVFYPTVTKYSKKHKYDRFSHMTDTRRPVEQYNVTMPDYVTVSYECVIWTDFTEHMNKIVESFQYATDEYWGDKSGFKFRVRIDSFDTTAEVAEGSERMIRTTFTLAVNAYLLPEKFDNEPTTIKTLSTKKVVWGLETDLTGGSGTQSATTQLLYNEYADIINFMSIRGSAQGEFVDSQTMKLTNVELPILPSELRGNFDESDWFRVYINGVYIQPTKFTYSYSYGTKEITFIFNTTSPASATTLGYVLENTDELGVTGKFIEL
jgi:hypothetical protein